MSSARRAASPGMLVFEESMPGDVILPSREDLEFCTPIFVSNSGQSGAWRTKLYGIWLICVGKSRG
jgi:hypothetical protein